LRKDGDILTVVTDPYLIGIVVDRHAMLSGHGQWDFSLGSCNEKIIEWENLENQWKRFKIEIDPQDYYELCRKSLLSKTIIYGSVFLVGVGGIGAVTGDLKLP
jgi:hypothetical protein